MAWTWNYSGVHEKLPRRALQITMARNNTTKNILQTWRKEEDTISFHSLEHFLSSFAAEPIRIAKSSLVAFERSLSSFEAKPNRNATPCLVACEHILSSFAVKPIRIDTLTLLPRDVCGYAHAKSTLPLTKARRSCFEEYGSKSTLMSGGAGGCAQGPVHCCWLYTCLCIACGSQSSTSHACCRTARASLHPFETFLWLALRRALIFGAVGLHAFCLPSLRTLHVFKHSKKIWNIE